MFEDSSDLQPERASSVSDIKIDVTDDEIKKLSEYFQKSREEFQKKVDSLLAMDLNKPARSSANSEKPTTEKKGILKTSDSQAKSVPGRPVDLATATALRELTVGSCVHSLSNDWRRAKFTFRAEDSELSYGLVSEKNGSKGLIMAVQCIVLRNLILRGYKDIHGAQVAGRILRPNLVEKRDVFVRSLADILWHAGEKKSACVALNGTGNCFEIPSSSDRTKRSNYYGDGITERLLIYEFNEFKVLEDFLRRNLGTFQKEDGCLLFLYSLILSRKLDRTREDLQGNHLIGDMEDCRLALFNLILLGVATPYVHNSTVYYDMDGHSLTKPLVGIKDRSDVGLLFWDPKEPENKRTEVGSMLKTPKYPIWLTIMGKNHIAILFNTNIDLINDWRFEKSFALHFYSGLLKQENEQRIFIDTRNNPSEILPNDKVLRAKYPNFFFNDDERETEIEKIIFSKWPGCEIFDVDCKELMTLL